ncbi:unnamed protein product [Closterium sp. Naga37s-1]|nr:unnamed protein product [Closterium sp. Naga37s-1]
MRDPLLKRGSAAVCGAVAAKAAAGGDGGSKHEGSEAPGKKCAQGKGAGGKAVAGKGVKGEGSGDEELKGLRKTVSGKNLRETKEKETMLKERQTTEKRQRREKKANKGKKEKKEKKETVEKKENLQRAKTMEEGDGAERLLKGRAAEEGVAGRGGAEEGDEAQPSGAEASRMGRSSAEDCAKEEPLERSWRTVFSAASSADRSPKPSRGLLTDPDPVPIQGSRLGNDSAPNQSLSFGAADFAPDQSGRSGGGWCGLCGDGGAEEWLQWQEHAMRHPVKVKIGGEEVARGREEEGG